MTLILSALGIFYAFYGAIFLIGSFVTGLSEESKRIQDLVK